MKPNREDVVQAALTVERWCAEHTKEDKTPDGWRLVCDCPLVAGGYCMVQRNYLPRIWGLEEFLRTRGLRKAGEGK